jgi:hypothetical protein
VNFAEGAEQSYRKAKTVSNNRDFQSAQQPSKEIVAPTLRREREQA